MYYKRHHLEHYGDNNFLFFSPHLIFCFTVEPFSWVRVVCVCISMNVVGERMILFKLDFFISRINYLPLGREHVSNKTRGRWPNAGKTDTEESHPLKIVKSSSCFINNFGIFGQLSWKNFTFVWLSMTYILMIFPHSLHALHTFGHQLTLTFSHSSNKTWLYFWCPFFF